MNSDPASSPRFLGMAPATVAAVLISVVTIFRLAYGVWLPLLPDEAYYYQWSHHLDASYFSKGPAVAYTIWAGTTRFGGNNFGIRFFAVMLSAGTAWQIFLLARRWYDETTGLIAVLVTGVVPIYAVGAVVMTIDPLSVFFWVWAAYLFSRAVQDGRMSDWLLAGFAVGSGFLAKYLNALELISFAAYLALVPTRRSWLGKPHFWLMLLVTAICTTPVWWWNIQHGWASAGQLANRGHLNGPFSVGLPTFLNFLGLQALVLSPWLFLSLLLTVIIVLMKWQKRKGGKINDGELLLFLLFVPVFLMYAVLALHMREEPNWPAVSYLSIIIIMSALWRKMLIGGNKSGQPFIVFVYLFAWAQTLLMHDTGVLHLPGKFDPMGRVVGWSDIAARLDQLRAEQQVDVIVADAYKEAAIFSFHMPNQPFIYTLRHTPPSNQYDFWPGYPKDQPVLWITGESSTYAMSRDFNTITFLERDRVYFHGHLLRDYTVYRCENR